jgi:hypothetical protein
MPTTMLIIIWGSFLMMSVGMILHGTVGLLRHCGKSTIIKKRRGPKNS